jgi:hypothetical protein
MPFTAVGVNVTDIFGPAIRADVSTLRYAVRSSASSFAGMNEPIAVAPVFTGITIRSTS